MLTTTNTITESQTTADVQNETFPSDNEIAARVLQIRQGWDLNERIQRRDEAERRFSKLIDTLSESTAA